MPRQKYEECQETKEPYLAGANAAKPYNQIEQLQMENEKLRAVINEQNAELLRLYRNLENLR